MKESQHVWLLIKGGFERAGMHMTRIENGAGVGQPDVNLWYLGKERWVELKLDKKRIGDWELRPSQKAWFVKRTMTGARGHFVLSRFDDTLTLWEPRFANSELTFEAIFCTSKPFAYDGLLLRIIQ